MLADRSLAWLFSERPHSPNKTQADTDTHSQTVDGAWGLLWFLIMEEGLQAPKGIATPQEDQQSRLTWTPEALRD